MTKVELTAPGVIALSGELLFATIMQVRSEVESLLSRQQGSCRLDFSAVTRVDSSVLALWLACRRLAARLGIELSAGNIPVEMSSIAELVGIDGALGQA